MDLIDGVVWQHPFADVFRLVGAGSFATLTRGDVAELMDKTIRRKVFRIRGKIAASNHLSVPAEGNSLQLTGRYIYLQLHRMPGESATLHLDIVTKKRSALRLSFSTMYSSVRSMGVNLRLPLPLSCDKWTVLALDMHRLLELHTSVAYNREGYDYLKSVQLCCSMSIRGVYTSDILYMPETLPKGMELPLLKSHAWEMSYDWHWLPSNQFDAVDTPATTPVPSKDVLRPPALASPARASPPASPQATPSPRKRPVPLKDDVSSTPLPLPLSQLEHEAQLQTHRSTVLQKADLILKRAGLQRPPPASAAPTSPPPSPKLYYSPSKYGPRILPKANLMWPDRVLALDRIVGISQSCTGGALWCHASKSFVYASDATLVLAERRQSSLAMSFLHGHVRNIRLLVLSPTMNMAITCEDGPSPALRLWSMTTSRCVGCLRGHVHGVVALAVGGTLLVVVGKDAQHRTQLIVYDAASATSSTSPFSTLPVVAKQTSDFPISNLRFSPYGSDRLVSCGRENIRFWRLKAGHLPGCPVVLHEYARDTLFTDIAFDLPATSGRPVYVSSSHGTILVIDDASMALLCVYKLHDTAIHCIAVNAGFCVSGGADGFLRVWPLDFSDFYLEASHEAAILSIDLSGDGLQALATCANGTIGVLDVSSHAYSIVHRAHTAPISAIALSPKSDALVSVALDHTIRVWDVATGLQTYEFKTEASVGTCIAHHPSDARIAVGFASGMLRIFDIPSMTILETYQQHAGPILDVQYGLQSVYSSGEDQQVCCYQHHSSTVLSVPGAFPVTNGRFCVDVVLQCLAIGGADNKSIELLDLYSLRRKQSLQYCDGKGAPMQLRMLGFVHHQQLLVLVVASQRLLLMAPSTGDVVRTWASIADGSVGDLAHSPFGRYVVHGRADGGALKVLMLEHPQQLRLTQSFAGQSHGLQRVLFSQDGKWVVTIGGSAALLLWRFLGYEDDLRATNTDSMLSEDALASIDEAALFELHHKSDNQLLNDTIEDEDESEDENGGVPRQLVPTPAQRPTRRKSISELPPSPIALSDIPWTPVVAHLSGFNVDATSPVVWSAVHQTLVRAVGSRVVVETPSTSRHECLVASSRILGLALAPAQDVVVYWDATPSLTFVSLNDVMTMTTTSVSASVRSVAFESSRRVWCIAGAELLLLDTDAIAASIALSDVPSQIEWLGHTTVDVVTAHPVQFWKVTGNAIAAVTIRTDISLTLVASSQTRRQCDLVLGWSAETSKLHILNTATSSIVCSATLQAHRRSTLAHLVWCNDTTVAVATADAPYVWLYQLELAVDGETLALDAMERDGLSLFTNTPSPSGAMSSLLRVDAPIQSMTWHSASHTDDYGIVITRTGAVWSVQPTSFTRQLLDLTLAAPITSLGVLPSGDIGTLSDSVLRLWDSKSLRECCYHATLPPLVPSAFATSPFGCVVGYPNGQLRVLSSDGSSSSSCQPWATETARSKNFLRRYTSDVAIDQLSFLRNAPVVLVGNTLGQLVLLSLPSMDVAWVPLPFGAQANSTLSSQNPPQVGGQLLHCSGAADAIIVVWASQAQKSHVHVYTGHGSVLQDAWKLPQVLPAHSWGVLAPHEDSVVLYSAVGGIEARCIQRRTVLWQCALAPSPTTAILLDDMLLLASAGTLHRLDLRDMALAPVAMDVVLAAAIESQRICHRNGALYIVDGNCLVRVELTRPAPVHDQKDGALESGALDK